MGYDLSNQFLRIKIAAKGAQLMSLYREDLQKEFLWQGDPVSWGDRAPLLFPACSRIAGNRVTAEGKEYFIPVQGFAKNREFALLERTSDSVTLQLSADEETLGMFPYLFRLQVRYSLCGPVVHQQFAVINDGKKDMPFSLGVHPGFFCPIDLREETADYVLTFDREQHIYRYATEDVTKLLLHEKTPFIEGRELPLSDTFFADGPKLLGGIAADWIRLSSRKSKCYVELGIKDFPYMAMWGLNKRMTFICLEPWCGTSDFADTDHVWETKPGNVHLAPGEKWTREIQYRMCKE